ncbi:hypothetical protein M408DRAFT_158985 [Serendipita vermifera MAFF 305830]|uniref:Uncharacterized protein n=1 Tax=Serendipita vermifera MAFF 305830 TaxID=933852 RepID=A0A0C2XXW2_SERVB|nr:hypothetical protein M408DRAFT_129683 [Serendipita vermifera MAFF 305830]KIM33697.1 hypothetical protein M408DRAFT_158985 [Serendipita vermifera MAFF 305830]
MSLSHPTPTSQHAGPDQEDTDHASSPESVQSSWSFLSTRSVKLMVLGELSNNNAQSISANSETTFGDVYRELGPIDINDLVLLEPHFGPRPYWTEARSTSPIGSTCSVIYCIKKWHSTQYTLGVVRSTLRDFPIAICRHDIASHPLFLTI